MVASNKSVIQKRRPGRPATGQTPIVMVRLPAPLAAAIARVAKEAKVNRSEAIRLLIVEGLAARGANKKERKRRQEPRDLSAAHCIPYAEYAAVPHIVSRLATPLEWRFLRLATLVGEMKLNSYQFVLGVKSGHPGAPT
jgi:hypothetical protein